MHQVNWVKSRNIKHVAGSHINLDTGYIHWGFSWFYPLPLGKLCDSTTNSATTTSFQTLFSSVFDNYPITLYNTARPTDSVVK
jgi:hypothetical protein